jgi:basic membrane protein A and related proteins
MLNKLSQQKFLVFVIALLAVGIVLVACATPATPAPPPTSPPAQPTAAPAQPTAVPAQPTTAAAGLKVGVVTDVGRINDKSFNQSSWEGAQCGAEAVGASEIKYIETTDSKDYEKNIAQFADNNYDVIVTVGFAIGDATIANAKKYPNVKFIGVDQFQAAETPNVVGLIFDEDKAGFLAGALAASLTKSGTIGTVLGTDTIPPVWRFGEGFLAGAKYVKPDINVIKVYHNDVGLDKTFIDPEWGKTTALSMIDKGADVIFGAGGQTGNGALIGGAEKGIMVIGVDTDQYETVPEAQKALVSSATKQLKIGVCDLIKAVKAGTFKGGNSVGPVGLAPYHDFESKVPDAVKAKILEIDKGLKDGTIKTGVTPAKPS